MDKNNCSLVLELEKWGTYALGAPGRPKFVGVVGVGGVDHDGAQEEEEGSVLWLRSVISVPVCFTFVEMTGVREK